MKPCQFVIFTTLVSIVVNNSELVRTVSAIRHYGNETLCPIVGYLKSVFLARTNKILSVTGPVQDA